MKKYLTMLLLALMSLCILTGCESSKSNDKKATTATASSSASKGTKDNPFILGVSPMAGWYAWYGMVWMEQAFSKKMVSM